MPAAMAIQRRRILLHHGRASAPGNASTRLPTATPDAPKTGRPVWLLAQGGEISRVQVPGLRTASEERWHTSGRRGATSSPGSENSAPCPCWRTTDGPRSLMPPTRQTETAGTMTPSCGDCRSSTPTQCAPTGVSYNCEKMKLTPCRVLQELVIWLPHLITLAEQSEPLSGWT